MASKITKYAADGATGWLYRLSFHLLDLFFCHKSCHVSTVQGTQSPGDVGRGLVQEQFVCGRRSGLSWELAGISMIVITLKDGANPTCNRIVLNPCFVKNGYQLAS